MPTLLPAGEGHTRARHSAGACVFQGPTGVRWAELRLPLLSKTGAVCGSSARTDLRGGRPAMTVPTATHFLPALPRSKMVPDTIFPPALPDTICPLTPFAPPDSALPR